MIDKGLLTGVAVAGISKLVAQVGHADGLPAIDTLSNLTATGALIFLVLWMTTKTIPAIVKDFREETRLLREERDKERERVVCKHPHDKGE